MLIRGPAGAGKSRLALALLRAAENGAFRFSRLVADDRTHLSADPWRACWRVRRRPSSPALIEVRGLGIRRLPIRAVAVVRLVVDLAAADAERLPAPRAARTVEIDGIILPRLAVAAGEDALPHWWSRADDGRCPS